MTDLPMTLKPMVDRLQQRTPLTHAESDALLALPHRFKGFDPGDYIIREGDQAEYCCMLISALFSVTKLPEVVRGRFSPFT